MKEWALMVLTKDDARQCVADWSTVLSGDHNMDMEDIISYIRLFVDDRLDDMRLFGEVEDGFDVESEFFSSRQIALGDEVGGMKERSGLDLDHIICDWDRASRELWTGKRHIPNPDWLSIVNDVIEYARDNRLPVVSVMLSP